jgi:hypothetical protein
MIVSLWIRETVGGKRTYRKPNKKKLYPNSTIFCLRYSIYGKRRWETIDVANLTAALAARATKEAALLLAVSTVASAPAKRINMDDAMAAYHRFIYDTSPLRGVVLGIRGDTWRLTNNINHLQAARIPRNSWGFLGILAQARHTMSLLGDEEISEIARQRESFRLTNVSSKLNRIEAERLDDLAKKHGLQRGEFIRQLILDELARESGEPTVSTELTEIIGLRLMLTNLLRPLATGQKLTPETFDGIIAEVKKHKRTLAVQTQTDLECA